MGGGSIARVKLARAGTDLGSGDGRLGAGCSRFRRPRQHLVPNVGSPLVQPGLLCGAARVSVGLHIVFERAGLRFRARLRYTPRAADRPAQSPGAGVGEEDR